MVAGQRLVLVAMVIDVVGVFALLAPWMRVGSVGKSSIELLADAGALDVLTGRVEVVVLVVWGSVPILAGVGLLALAARRWRLGAGVFAVVGLLLLGAAVALVGFAMGHVAWGALVGGACGGIGCYVSVVSFRLLSREGNDNMKGWL